MRCNNGRYEPHCNNADIRTHCDNTNGIGRKNVAAAIGKAPWSQCDFNWLLFVTTRIAAAHCLNANACQAIVTSVKREFVYCTHARTHISRCHIAARMYVVVTSYDALSPCGTCGATALCPYAWIPLVVTMWHGMVTALSHPPS